MVFSVIFVIAVFVFLFYIISKGSTISSRGTTSKTQAWWPFVGGSSGAGFHSSGSSHQQSAGGSGGIGGSFGGFGGGHFGGGGASGSW